MTTAGTTATDMLLGYGKSTGELRSALGVGLMPSESGRAARIREAVLSRIADYGDQEIKIGRWALASLFDDIGERAGRDAMRETGEDFYEVPARVLEALVIAAGRLVEADARLDRLAAMVTGVR